MPDKTAAAKERPLSPHLQVYKPQMTSVMSILHRATGVFLVLGMLLVTWVLVAAASGPESFEAAMDCLTSPLGQIALLGWTASLYYHMCNGVRHLFWDMGYLFKLENAFRAGWLVLFSTAALTAATWYWAYYQ